ncbi:MAG: alpha/beta hydrolase [bacterium]|nr:alpha/beta hydrolase [bacterium]
MKLVVGIVLIALSLTACGADESTAEGAGVHIPVTGGELNAVQGIHLCDAAPSAEPVVLFLHGASFNANTWVETGTHQTLCEAAIPSLSIDLPGFGKSARFDHDPVQLLNDVVDFIDGTVVVVSPSMSGNYSLPWLATNPAAAAGYVPVAPVGIGSWVTPPGFEVPTLGIWGGEDSIVPVSQGERLIAAIPGAKLVVFEGGHHAVYKFDPDRFNAALVEFVQGLAS